MILHSFKKRLLSILLLTPILLGTQACDPDPKEAELKAKVDAFVQQKMEESGTKGLTLAIVQRDRIIHARGFGFADESTQKAVSTKTLFRVGSISKVFTASAIMQLQETGRLDIDQPLVEYLPDFSIKTGPLGKDSGLSYRDITLRHIQTHRSGLPSDYFHNNYSRIPPSMEEYAAQFKDEYNAYPPGQVTAYSNSATTLQGRVIENLTGMSFYEYMENQLLSPSGMELSSFRLREDMHEHLSKAYKGGVETPHVFIAEAPAGSLYSNADEMSNFIRMILNKGRFAGKRVLKRHTLKKMFRQQNRTDQLDQKTNTKSGLAWFIQEDYAGKTVMHNGGTQNFFSNLYITPGQNLGVFVSVNTAESAGTMAEIAAFTHQLSLELLRDLKKPTPPVNDHVPAPWTDENLEKIPGLYSIAGLGLIKVVRQEQKLELLLQGQQFNLALMSDGEILLQMAGQSIPGVNLSFETIDDKELLIFKQNGNGVAGLRLTKPEIPEAWLARQGVYFNNNPGGLALSAAQIVVENGVLLVRAGNDAGSRLELVLIPVGENRAYIHGIGRNAGETLRFDESGNLLVLGNVMVALPDAGASPGTPGTTPTASAATQN